MKQTTFIAAALALICSAGLARAQGYPNAPIHLVSGFQAGSTVGSSTHLACGNDLGN